MARKQWLEGFDFTSISDDDGILLEHCFDELQVLSVVKILNGFKAPEPDDFLVAFFQRCWTMIEAD